MDDKTLSQIVSIIDDANDMTVATVRPDGYPEATTVSYLNGGLAIYFGTLPDSRKSGNTAQCNKVSMPINRAYDDWDQIEGLSIAGSAMLVTDPAEQQKTAGLMFENFPQIAKYAPSGTESVDLFRIDPKVISLLDYTRGFGHTELVTV